MNIALGIEYDGSQFHGWQAQPNLRTVQGELCKALSKVADNTVQIHCAGRTDTGVHATGQVISFTTSAERHTRAWVYGANSNLPQDISVIWAKAVDEAFHARYTAEARRYKYVIYNHPVRPSLMSGNLTWQYRPLDDQAMHVAAQHWLGENDFTSFRAVACQSSTPMRCLNKISVTRQGDLVIMDVTANAFLHHMVRNMAGVLISIGTGKRQIAWAKEVLLAKDRRMGAETAPPYGLYLVDVSYPESYQLPRENRGPAFLLD